MHPADLRVSCRNLEPRVVISVNTAWNIANFRAGLVRGLIGAGYEVVAIAAPDRYVAQLETLGCRFVPVPIDSKGVNPLRDAILFVRYLKLFMREAPQAYLGFTIKPNVYGSLAAQLCGIPVINNVSGLGTAFIRDTWVTSIAKKLYRTAFRGSHRVYFQNHEDLSLFLETALVDVSQTGLLPGSGIDLNRFTPMSPETPRAHDAPVFTLIARLISDKGIEEYVDAARQVRRRFPRAQFHLLGFLDVENQTALTRAMVDAWVREGVIQYLGTTDDVRPIIGRSDCVVLPSYREGTPRTLLEAAAMGKPLIATDVPGCRNVVEHRKNGFLCQVRSSNDLARKMLDFIELSPEARRAQGHHSRQLVERSFNENIVVDAYLSDLHRLAPVPHALYPDPTQDLQPGIDPTRENPPKM